VIGPNGAGKSTLLRILGLLERPDEGHVLLDGCPVDARNALAERRRMATVFQEPLLADATVADNAALGLRFRGVPAADRTLRVRRWLERLGVAALASRAARTLSGGEAQRVALARALALEPEGLLLDEPVSGLDAPTRAALGTDLGGVLRADRVTTVLVTHERGEAQALADRVGVLMDGRLRQLDETARVFYAPASEDVARFVGVETLVAGRVLSREAGVTAVEVGGRGGPGGGRGGGGGPACARRDPAGGRDADDGGRDPHRIQRAKCAGRHRDRRERLVPRDPRDRGRRLSPCRRRHRAFRPRARA